jgi:ubiquinone/menaquinone biosynthesis C-methylase UbiE
MRILDYGCGSGESVLRLRLLGYEAFGVDIDKSAISTGQKLLSERGFDGLRILFSFDENSPVPFNDKFFHFITSHEVIEHVGNISMMARDLRRVSAPGGWGFHVFRPQYNIIEPHFFMPFVHWLPKNALRKNVIMLFAYLGLGLRPSEIPEAGPRERANFLYQYSVNRTFYRPFSIIGEAFSENGFRICFPATNHRKIKQSKLFSWLRNTSVSDHILGWTIMTFLNAYLLTQTPVENERIDEQSQLGNWKFESLN